MPTRTSKPPLRGLLIRIGAFCGLVYGFSHGVLGQVDKAMNCNADGVCVPKQESVGAADVLVPIVLGVPVGAALGLLVAIALAHVAREL